MNRRIIYEGSGRRVIAEQFNPPNPTTHKRDRVRHVEFTVGQHRHGEGGKPAAADPISCLPTKGPPPRKGPYEKSQLGTADQDLQNFDKGHLMALEFGGPNDWYNVVPMYQSFNRRGPWRQLENKLKKLKKTHHGAIEVGVSIHYQSDGRIPDRFNVEVYAGEKDIEDDLWDRSIKHLVPARIKVSIPNEIAEVFAWGRDSMPANWGRERTMFHYPTRGERPYEVLAYIEEKQGIDVWPDYLRSLDTIGSRRNFAPKQRSLIHWYNRWNRIDDQGYLVSDDPQDPELDLNEFGGDDASEVDHIVPKVRGGSNDFRNARLVSWKLNNSEERIKDTEDLFD